MASSSRTFDSRDLALSFGAATLLFAAPLCAQIANATLSGSVTDPAAAGEPRDMQFALKLVF